MYLLYKNSKVFCNVKFSSVPTDYSAPTFKYYLLGSALSIILKTECK